MLANLTLMVALGWHNWARLFVWLAIGLVIYASYGYRHSRLAGGGPLTDAARTWVPTVARADFCERARTR